MTIPRLESEGSNTLWYRDPVICNFVDKIAKVQESLTSFKNTIRKLQAVKEALFLTKTLSLFKKKNDFIYFWLMYVA